MSRLPKHPTTFLMLLAAFLAAPPAGRAQQGPTASEKELYDKYDAAKKNLIAEFVTGKRQPRDTKEDQAAIKAAAEWFVYRLRITTWQAQPNKLHNDVFLKFKGEQGVVRNYKDKNQAYQKFLTRELLACLRDVLDRNTPEAQVVVNAAMMLPELAKGGREEVGDFLAELVRDPKRHDVIKLYALRGLGEYFGANEFDNPNAPKVGPLADAARKERDAQRVQAVIDFLKRKPPLTPDMTPEQVEAVRYIRREAVRAFIPLRVPALDVDAKRNKVLGPVAVALLGVLATKGEGAELPPSLGERVDAAVALCHMKGTRIAEFDQRLTVAFVAAALADFATEYNGDFKNVILSDKDRKDKVGALHPWLAYSDRLNSGLRELEKNTRNDRAVNDQVKELTKKADLLLTTTRARKLQVNEQAIDGVRTFSQSVFPKMKFAPAYRGIKDQALAVPLG
jgi:hypothetical protein